MHQTKEMDSKNPENLRKTQLRVTEMLKDIRNKTSKIGSMDDDYTVLKWSDELADMKERQSVIEAKAGEAREIAGIPAPEQAWGSAPSLTLLTPREIGAIQDESVRDRVLALYKEIEKELDRDEKNLDASKVEPLRKTQLRVTAMLKDIYDKTSKLASADDHTALKWQDELADMKERQSVIEAKAGEAREIAGISAAEQAWGSKPNITLLTPREIGAIQDDSVRDRVLALYEEIKKELDR